MASEYLLKKAQEAEQARQPEEPIIYTPKEKFQNWLHYHWYWFVIGAVFAVMVGALLWNFLGIGKVKPDYIFAYVGKEPISKADAEQIEAALASLGTDTNGDGKVKVELRQYALERSGDEDTAMLMNRATSMRLMGDLTAGESYFFLMEEPASFQYALGILANPDGSAPDMEDDSVEGKAFRWSDCPALTDLPVPSAVSEWYLGRRHFRNNRAEGHEGEAALWELLTAGAREGAAE